MVDELKAKAYDMEKLYEEYKQKMDAIIKEAEEKAASYGNEQKDEVEEAPVIAEPVPEESVVPEEPSVELPTAEVEEAPVIAEPVPEEPVVPEEPSVELPTAEVEEAPVIAEPVQGEPVVPEESSVELPTTEVVETPVVEEPVPEKPVVPEEPSVELPTTEVVETPVVEEPVKEDGIGTQELDQTPLAPVGVENENSSKKVIEKEDSVSDKAIIVTTNQNIKLERSKPEMEKKALGEQVVENAPAAESKEEINKQLEAMFDQLRTTTDENVAKEINDKIGVLTKKLGEVA